MTNKFDGINAGDRVRVVIEGEVTAKYGDFNIDFRDIELFSDDSNAEYIVSVEKLEPEFFGPGDVVKAVWSDHVFTIGKDGYFCHTSKTFTKTNTAALFVSSNYELLASTGGAR